jgi:hypothetical protein
MEILKYVLLTFVALFGGYILFRVISIAIFKSWFDVKNQSRERKDEDDNRRND